MRYTLPQSTPVRDRAGTGVNGNDLTKYSRCSMEMKFVANVETLTPRCSSAAFSTFIICRFKSPWIPVVACPRMLWSAAGMTRGLVSALDTKPDCVVALPLSMNPLKLPLATLPPFKKRGTEGDFSLLGFAENGNITAMKSLPIAQIQMLLLASL